MTIAYYNILQLLCLGFCCSGHQGPNILDVLRVASNCHRGHGCIACHATILCSVRLVRAFSTRTAADPRWNSISSCRALHALGLATTILSRSVGTSLARFVSPCCTCFVPVLVCFCSFQKKVDSEKSLSCSTKNIKKFYQPTKNLIFFNFATACPGHTPDRRQSFQRCPHRPQRSDQECTGNSRWRQPGPVTQVVGPFQF